MTQNRQHRHPVGVLIEENIKMPVTANGKAILDDKMQWRIIREFIEDTEVKLDDDVEAAAITAGGMNESRGVVYFLGKRIDQMVINSFLRAALAGHNFYEIEIELRGPSTKS